jgi:chromosome segregation ATPase
MDIEQIKRNIKNMSAAVDNAKRDTARAEGSLQQVEKQLKELDIDSSIKLESRLKELEKRKISIEKTLLTKHKELEEHYEW